MSAYLLYQELNGISIVLLLWILVTVRRNDDLQTKSLVFYREVALTMGILLVDMLWSAIDGKSGDGLKLMNNILNAVYYSLAGMISLGFLMYGIFTFKPSLYRKRTLITAIVLPELLITIASCASPWTHWVFYIDSKNFLHKASWSFVIETVVFLYYLTAVVFMLIGMFFRKSSRKAIRRLPMKFPCMLLLIVASIVVFAMRYFDSLWPIIAVMLMFAFTDSQYERISVDSLTGLNNRTCFDKRIALATSSPLPPDRDLYLFMMDVDFFKKINDTYGHLEGDSALKITAEILRKVCSEERSVLARYGGDEFACIYYCSGDREADALKKNILDAFIERNKNSNDAFPINVSIGYAKFGEDGVYNDIELINKADEALYKVKQVSHRGKRLR